MGVVRQTTEKYPRQSLIDGLDIEHSFIFGLIVIVLQEEQRGGFLIPFTYDTSIFYFP